MLTYSIAIRTLGTSGEMFRQELISITQQTVQPQRVMVYIAEGYERPDYTIGKEEYHWVPKGMMAQRILPYEELDSDCVLMLDDDVWLAPDSAERLLHAMEEKKADCVGVDSFENHEMSLGSKIYAAMTNLVFPHYSDTWAFKIHRNGSFSYNNYPKKSFYWSQSCAGPASLWRLSTYKKLHMKDELWLDGFGFAYGDDALEFYKIYRNGYNLGILNDSGVVHLDGGSDSARFRKSAERIYIRTKASFCIWWRTCYQPSDLTSQGRAFTAFCYLFKAIWLFFVMCIASLVLLKPSIITLYIQGLWDGWKYVHSESFGNLPNYVLKS